MWNTLTGSNTRKRTVFLISVTICIFVIYAQWSKAFGIFSNSKGNSKPDNVNLFSEKLRAAANNQLTSVKNVSDKRTSLPTLQDSNFELKEINSFDITTLTNVTNATEIEQVNKTLTLLSRQVGSDSVIDWSKFQHISFRQKPKQNMSDLPYFLRFEKAAYDIMNMEPITFDPAFKNPCWRGGDSFTSLNDGSLHCLPYFYIIGVKKSGTTDLYVRMKRHAEFCEPFRKGSQWFPRLRFGTDVTSRINNYVLSIIQRGFDPRKVEFFISLFDKPALCISRSLSTRRGKDPLRYKMVTAEASPSTFHMHTNWERLPGNENLNDPRYTNFQYIKHITPNVKIIILFRDPTTRLYSDFLHTTRVWYGRYSPYVFHRDVIQLIEAYKSCFRRFSQRSCVYNNTLKQELRSKGVILAESFNAGFYAVYMKELLAVFGKAQLFPILMTDYITKMEKTLRNAFSFLDMSSVSSRTMRRMLKIGPQNVSNKKKAGIMLVETRDMLYEFYRPYNEDMVTLMNDTQYLFPKP
ncbi:carbohydrate sulfotransferase 15-like [Mercenaria mercenaria]|uniref:carbohydrate sulfotransferase 15-like n=1 Tax=Mercenaria mercenaria TaxID=6596 RepID=UPI00234F2083|nr:carbohydrate sulfotransferase 15-like [Mercenaria mercenaria]